MSQPPSLFIICDKSTVKQEKDACYIYGWWAAHKEDRPFENQYVKISLINTLYRVPRLSYKVFIKSRVTCVSQEINEVAYDSSLELEVITEQMNYVVECMF